MGGKRRYSVTLSEPFVEAVQTLVDEKTYESGPAVIRDALRKMFRAEGFEAFTTGKRANGPTK